MLTITAVIRAKQGREDVVERALRAVVAEVRANEPGTVAYVVSRSTDEPAIFTTFERFVDAAAMTRHNEFRGRGRVRGRDQGQPGRPADPPRLPRTRRQAGVARAFRTPRPGLPAAARGRGVGPRDVARDAPQPLAVGAEHQLVDEGEAEAQRGQRGRGRFEIGVLVDQPSLAQRLRRWCSSGTRVSANCRPISRATSGSHSARCSATFEKSPTAQACSSWKSRKPRISASTLAQGGGSEQLPAPPRRSAR